MMTELSGKAPSYSVEIKEKQQNCSLHPASKTPLLDAHLRQQRTQELMRSLGAALIDTVDRHGCAQCNAKDAVHALTVYMRDLREEKKENGKWFKEDKRALKVEVKAFLKEIKRDAKQAWKGSK